MQVDLIDDPKVVATNTYKVLIIGSAGVGKTCFLMRVCSNSFSQTYATTLGKSITILQQIMLSSIQLSSVPSCMQSNVNARAHTLT